jgi:hypothetical protein
MVSMALEGRGTMKQAELQLRRIDPESLKLEPKETITPYELAMALPIIQATGNARWALFVGLQESVKRHFTWRYIRNSK